MASKNPANDTITFLGTGGARFMMTSQILASGGLWLNLSGTEILIDPGPGCIVQSTKMKLRAENLSAIILSHRHLDHSGDVNVMAEAMTQNSLTRHGWLFAPADALGTEPVIFSYLKERLEGVQTLAEGKSYSVDNITLTTPVRHQHLVETYGMVFRTTRHTFSYITDTRYFEGLSRHYRGELLIMNVVFLERRSPSDHPGLPVDHLSVPDAAHIILELKPRVAILTHFGMNIWQANPWHIAEWLTEKTGVKVIAARDGMRFDLGEMDNK